jgi:hypothetical protein
MSAGINIGGTVYTADTIMRRQVGPGIYNTIIRIPDYPLNVYLLETDLTNPYNRVETTIGYNTLGRTELLTNAYNRNRTETRRPIAACNANFWCVTGNGSPTMDFELGDPFGAVVRNDSVYLNTESNADAWNGGPSRTGACAITQDKTLYFGHFNCGGTISSPKLPAAAPMNTVNRRNLPHTAVLWTPAFSRTRQFETNWLDYNEQGVANADNFYLTFNEGSRWLVNQDMSFTISKIVRNADRQTLCEYDACITATGLMKDYLAPLEEGDVITLNHGWTYNEESQVTPFIENMVEGNAPVMHNGELTNRNNDESYNSMVYSRTAYGCDATGKKLYMIVIDKSTSRYYGTSNGCSTTVMCQILKDLYPDISEVVNMDAGGSAEMMVDGRIINTTTEGTPRAVACGWMLETEAPQDSTIASIQFYDFRADLPIYSSYTPRIVGFNQYGEVINDNLTGFTLTCDEELGYTEDSTLVLGGNVTTATVTAHYNGMTATIPVRTIQAQPSIAMKPMILVDNREFPIEVSATIYGKKYYYDGDKLTWEVDDPSIATITNGKLKGNKNGKTAFSCIIGDFVDNDSITVEISDQEYIEQTWDGWALKGAGAKNLVLDENGNLSFTYSSNRAPYIQLSKEITFYSLPDSIYLTFTSSLPLQMVQIDVRNTVLNKLNYLEFGKNTGFEANQEYTLNFDLNAMGGLDNLLTYPLTLHTIKFTPVKSNFGEHLIQLKTLRAHYPVVSAKPGDVNGDGFTNAADITALYDYMLNNDSSSLVNGDQDEDGHITSADITKVYSILLGN